MAAGLSEETAYDLVRTSDSLNGRAFAVLGTIARLLSTEQTEQTGRDLLIRVLELRDSISRLELPLLESLVSRVGLYPYVTNSSNLSTSDQIAYEYHRPEELDRENFIFHAEQQAIFQRILAGESIMLSAPTSFGKSAISDALVASGRRDQIAVVVPTLALIDETRRRLARFSDRYKINTFPGQAVNAYTIFIMTQERLLELRPFPSIGLFVIDEFYKLDSASDDERGALLNIAWDKLRRTGAQYYLTGPNVSGLSPNLPETLKAAFVRSDFRTVAVDQDRISREGDERDRVVRVCQTISGQTLMYCRSPQRVRELGRWLLEAGVGDPTPQGQIAAEWVASNYDPEWVAGKCLAQGIGLHHGRIPRAMQHHTVRLFNSGVLRFLICTSTLIEGVNTAARNVIIVDDTLDRQALDYFTFSNIRGRAGRMFRHFVGHVYVLGNSPEATQTTIDIPISSQSRGASTAALLQLPESELNDESRERLAAYYDQSVVGIDVLRANSGVDPDRQLAVGSAISQNLERWHSLLGWSGIPTFDQTVAIFDLMLTHLLPGQLRRGVNGRSLATRLGVLQRYRASIPPMVEAQLRFSESRDDAVEEVLYFLRTWTGHILPRSLMAIEGIQADIFERVGLQPGRYAYFARLIEDQFLPQHLVTLEEYGLPTAVAVKLQELGLEGPSLDELLESLRVVAASPVIGELLAPFEQEMLGEVVTGLGPGAGRLAVDASGVGV